jgi:hypothetical protein
LNRQIRTQISARCLLAAAALLLTTAAAAQQPAPLAHNFHVSHYEIDATLRPTTQTLQAKAQVEFVADQASRDMQVELNPNLKINSLQLNGQDVQFTRLADQPLNVAITLPNPVPTGEKVTLTFDYAGPLASDEGSPSKDVRLAYIGKDNAYLLLDARWFPLTNYMGQRYTAVFHLTVPGNFAVVGTGTSGVPDTVPPPKTAQPGDQGTQPPGAATRQKLKLPEKAPQAASQAAGQAAAEAQWLRYTFTADQPGMSGTFVAAGLELSPENAAGLSLSVYTQPKDKGTAAAYTQSLAKIISFYSSEFGPLPNRPVTLAQLPSSAPMDGVAAPGLLLVNQRQWSERPSEQLLARLAAHLWWNDAIEPATPGDGWLSEGLSRYSAVLYEESVKGDAGLHQALDSCAVGALMDESAAPIGQAWRLQPYTTAYQSVVVNKGAMVFHMLRSSIGDDAFVSLLREYLQKYSGKTATIDDFQQLTAAKIASLPQPALPEGAQAPPQLNALAFFSQWINSTGIPEFSLEYIVYRTQKGFRVVGKVKQNLTTLNMPIQVKVETEGNPVTKTVQVVGDSSAFTIETFGEPKSGGIILDPNNNVLKSTPGLRVRAMIARGEALAEQGQFFQAVQQYQRALDIQRQNGLALFRMGEAMFYQKNYQAAANAFRDSLDGQIDPSFKWIEVWDHIYLGKIYDLIGQRERAMNEYQKAIDTKDDTGGAQEQAQQYMKKPFSQTASKSGS